MLPLLRSLRHFILCDLRSALPSFIFRFRSIVSVVYAVYTSSVQTYDTRAQREEGGRFRIFWRLFHSMYTSVKRKTWLQGVVSGVPDLHELGGYVMIF